jgi:uracil-DNA glycosylase family 4
MSTHLSPRKVPHVGPLGAKIFVIGEAPGATEDQERRPFVGAAGQKAFDEKEGVFPRYGIKYEHCRIGNICNYKPDGNLFEYCLNTPEITEGLIEIREYLQKYPPNVIVAFGGWALDFLCNRTGIIAHRGSILDNVIVPGIKVIPTLHPAYVLRNPSDFVFFDFDIRRIVEDSKFPQFNYTKRNYHIVDEYNIFQAVDTIKKCKLVSCDIESTKKKPHNLICVGFAVSKHDAYIFPWNDLTKPVIRDIIEDEKIEKVFHFGHGYDVEKLYLEGINIKGKQHDTFLMAQTVDPGFPKDLGFLTSIHTREPYYKTQGRNTLPADSKSWGAKVSKTDTYIYNGKDCCVTYEIAEKLMYEIRDLDIEDQYEFMLEQLLPARDISRNGLPIDRERMLLMRRASVTRRLRLQTLLNNIAGRPVNVNSHVFLKKWLYTEEWGLQLPERRDYKGGLSVKEEKLASLIAFCQEKMDESKKPGTKAQWEIKQMALKIIIDIKESRKLESSYLNPEKLHDDDRMRSIPIVGGTETDRWSMIKYVDGKGCNAQTMPRGIVVIPDDLNELLEENEIGEIVVIESRVIQQTKDRMLTDDDDDDEETEEDEAA